MKAIVYAAGRGVRLGPRYAGRQKLLLEFGGRSLLEWHALRLAQAGVDELVVVTGYRRETVADLLPGVAARHGLRVREKVNADYDEGSVLSVAVSLPEIENTDEPLLLMDGDVLYPGGFIERLIASPHESALLVDRHYATTDDDPVLVPLRGGQPFEFLKGWRGEADAVGESVGLFKLGPRDVPALVAATHERLHGAGRGESYDEIIRALVRAGSFGAEDVSGEPWTEIDFPEDVERALDGVLRAITALEG